MSWIAWALLLLAQNASFTWVSRARNSKSLGYHAIASVFSNGVWFVSLAVAMDKVQDALLVGDWSLFGFTALYYTFFTVVGSVGMHHFLMTKVER